MDDSVRSTQHVEVIILAQGDQKRMGARHGYKQLLPLPACADVPIIIRTLAQLTHRLGDNHRVTMVCWDRLAACIGSVSAMALAWPRFTHVELPQPGNSSLKGIFRYLETRSGPLPESTVVLLGDVVYSWACLDALLAASKSAGFVGTADLRNDGGELWGVAWGASHHNRMMMDLRDALLRHPPFEDEYQPGQLRRWISGWHRGDLRDHVTKLRGSREYFVVDDYTMDVDLPAHIQLLRSASVEAEADDRAHGLEWKDNGTTAKPR